MTKPLVLIILDGWGLAPPGPGNAISLAKLTNIPEFWQNYPHTELAASGVAVGLPDGEDGNTETGHINLGAGRVVYQDLPKINMSITDHSFFRNTAFLEAIRFSQKHKSNLHLIGLISESGNHAKIDHLIALLKMIKSQQYDRNVYLHLFTDGRDSPPKSGKRFISEIEIKCEQIGLGKIATVIGRYFAMDRDRRWERTQVAYQALTEIILKQAPNAISVLEEAYKTDRTDEFIEPTIIIDENGQPYPRITDNDSVIFFNYRIDRPRQLTKAFVLPDFETSAGEITFDPYSVKYYHKHVIDIDGRTQPFKRNIVLKNLFFVTMTEYERNLPCVVAFPPESVEAPLGRIFADHKIRQLRVAETEKERFVTYYFNGMHEDHFLGEDRLIISSPNVANYDLQPEMSSQELTEKLIDRLSLGIYGFVLVNIANPDMVAHTGNIQAAKKACEIADDCIGKIVDQVLKLNGTCILTSDHGNVEEMLGSSGEIDTEHSTFPVPFIIINNALKAYPLKLPSGQLADVAPTILGLLKLKIPKEMTGKNLLLDIINNHKGGVS